MTAPVRVPPAPTTGQVDRAQPTDAPGPVDGVGRRPGQHPVRMVVVYGLLIVLSVGFLVPWAWMLSTSLKSPDELAAWPPIWIPETLRWDNFAEVFRQVPFLRYISNTVVIAVASMIGCVVSNTLVAYGFACLRWPGRDVVFGIVIATLMLPAFVTFIPLYTIYAQFGWINTYAPLIVPTFLGNAFFIFLLRQFFRRIPPDLADAARIDGASEIRIFTSVALPLVRPAIVVVALLQFIASWNDFFGPLIYLSDSNLYTISLGIASMQSTYGFSNFSWIMAATTMSVLPIVMLFFGAQKSLVEGVALSGLKG